MRWLFGFDTWVAMNFAALYVIEYHLNISILLVLDIFTEQRSITRKYIVMKHEAVEAW